MQAGKTSLIILSANTHQKPVPACPFSHYGKKPCSKEVCFSTNCLPGLDSQEPPPDHRQRNSFVQQLVVLYYVLK